MGKAAKSPPPFPDGDEIGTAVGESIPTPSPRARRANDTFPGKGCLEAAAAIKRLEALLDSFPPSCPPPEDRTLFEAAIADSLRNVLQIGREVADAVIRVERRIGDYNLETRRAFVGLRRNLTGEVKTADIRARSRSADLESGLREELDQVHGKMDLLKPPSPASYRSEGEGGERVEGSKCLYLPSCSHAAYFPSPRQTALRTRSPVPNTLGRQGSS